MLSKILAMFTQTFGPIYGYHVIMVITQEKSMPQASGIQLLMRLYLVPGEMVYHTLVSW